MADEEPCSPHGWTLDTLEKFMSDKIAALDRFCVTNFAQSKERVDMALAASDKAIVKAENTTEKRFEGVNEFRSALSDQSATLLPRSEYTVQHKALEDRVVVLGNIVTRMTGKSEGIGNVGSVTLAVLVGVSSLCAIAALGLELFRHEAVPQPVIQYVPAPTAVPAPITVPR